MMLPQSRISSSSSSRWFLLRVLFLVVSLMTLTEAWVPTSQHHRVASRRSHASSSATTKLGFFGAAPVDDMTPGDYACKVCIENEEAETAIVLTTNEQNNEL